ncbi:MAG: ParA family protein [Dissulfurispiraceae bacterium]
MLTAAELAGLVGKRSGDIARLFNKRDLHRLSSNRKGIPPRLVREYLISLGFSYNFSVVAHINLRGGIGKTTSTISAASRACQYGFKTCILDMDPQGSSSLAFDVLPGREDPIFYDVWQKPSEMVMGSLKKIGDYLYILPSSLENALLDSSLINPSSQKKAARGVCDELRANGFDLVVIDCPPSLGIAVISSICAADTIVVPVCSDAFSFKGLELTLNEITSICDTFHLEKPVIRVLFTKFDRRVKISHDALGCFRSDYSDYFIPDVIRTSTEFSKALAMKETIFASPKKNLAREDYDRYVRHITGLNRSFPEI